MHRTPSTATNASLFYVRYARSKADSLASEIDELRFYLLLRERNVNRENIHSKYPNTVMIARSIAE
jgi:hypothetical protein